MASEVWKSVAGWEDKYEISDHGRLRSLELNRVCDIEPNVRGYIVTSFFRGGKAHSMRLHRIVAEAFIPNPENKPTVNHKNGFKHDNRAGNLEWATRKEQEWHKLNVLGKTAGLTSAAKLTANQVAVIRARYQDGRTKGATGSSYVEMAREFGVTWHTIRNAVVGKTWQQKAPER